MDNFFQSMFSASGILWILLSVIITGLLCGAINIYKKATGGKTGFICAVAFVLGVASVHYPFF